MNKVYKRCSSIPTVHMLWGKTGKCSLLQTELKGLMHHTAYFILKCCGSSLDPCHFIQSSAAAPEPSSRAAEIRTGKRKKAGLAVATETMSSLLNTCFWWRHTPGSSTHNWGLWNRQDGAAERKVRCLSAHEEREPLFFVVAVGGGAFGFHYINKEVRESSVA